MRTLAVLPALVLFLVLPGCLLLAGAAAGAGAIVVTGEDTVTVDIRASRDAVYATAEDQVESAGEVTGTYPESGIINAEVEDSKVEVAVRTVDDFTRVRVKARKLAGTVPDLDLAQKLAREISRAAAP